MSCIPDVPPTNPISQLIVNVLGDNFSPPFDPNFSPQNREKLVSEKGLQMRMPGGGAIMPTGDNGHKHISDLLTPITGMMGTLFSVFAPLYIILDVIRALIDIICALFNPIPLILSVVDLFLNVLPPLIALFPPFSSILLALNLIKLIVTIIGAIAASLIPIIIDIVENALQVPAKLSEGNLAAVDFVETKLCELFQEFANVIAGLAPLKFLLEMIDIFMGLGSKLFCMTAQPGQPGSPCCTTENCPPVIINPPTGRMTVLNTVKKFTLQDMLNLVFGLIKMPLEDLSNFLNDALGKLFDGIDVIVNGIKNGIEAIVKPIEDVINGILAITGASFELPQIDIPNLDIPKPNLNLQLTTPQGFDNVVFIEPLMTLQYVTAVSKENSSGLVSAVGIGHPFTRDELATVQNFIIDPDKIPSPAQKMPGALDGQSQTNKETKPVTLQVRLKSTRTGKEVIADALFEFPTLKTIANNLGLSQTQAISILNSVGLGFLPLNYLGIIQVRDDSFEAGESLEYELMPNYLELLKQNLIGLGCYPDIQVATQATAALINADVPPGGGSGFDPVIVKIGKPIPRPPTQALQDLLNALQVDPTIPVDPLPVINGYLDDLADVYDSLLCAGSSSVQSLFEASKTNVLSNGRDRVLLSVRIKDAGGNDLLVGGKIPSSTFRVQFQSTKGEIGPVEFDETTGTFNAIFSNTEVGEAEITAFFIVRDQVCTKLSTFENFPTPGTTNVKPKIIKINSVPEKTAYPRARKQNQYVQSRGGRTRR